ncbi:MAG: tRNA (adenine-N(6)-)-methyltransferase [Firmicutes bacterium]|nr:tRNA (adenine-N(6)-)-methyltransferase [Bacillota bacterium]
MNKGYLTCGRGADSDEVYTPFYAVEPIVKYIPKGFTIWCPFDEEWSAFVQVFRERGYKVIHSHIGNGQDFFDYTLNEHYDCIVSNPPFSKKDKVLKRLYELGKPFAVLLPLNSLQGIGRFKSFQKGVEILAFDKRVDYHTHENYRDYTKGNHFASAYFCHGLLPNSLILEELKKYERPLKVRMKNT